MENKCILENPFCKRNCGHCGWNPTETEMRNKQLSENGLTPNRKGLLRLVIVRDEE
jgi:hypothetical protein